MKRLILMSTSLLIAFGVFGQTPIDVADNTLKVGGLGEEVFYYGFCEGDQCIFNFEEVNGKELKEIEIVEMPSSSKYMDYKTKKVDNKTLNITKTGIYKFRFSNSALGGRICKFRIQRVPANDAVKNFNTSVYWKTVYDTTYTPQQEKYLVKSDTTIVNLSEQTAKVHSSGNLNGNITTLNFSLPENTISWSYYIGVDQAGQQAYEKATQELSKNAGPLLSKMTGYGPLAALALGGVSYLSQLQAGEDIDFWFQDLQTGNTFKHGKIMNDYSKMLSPLKGHILITLQNDNAVTGVSVSVRLTAITVNQQWGERTIQKMNVSSHQEAYLKN